MAVAKVFTITLTGGPVVTKGIDSISSSMAKLSTQIAKTKAQLAEVTSKNVDTAGIDKLNAKLTEQQGKFVALAQARGAQDREFQASAAVLAELNDNTDRSITKFQSLNQAFKESKANVQEMAAAFGVDSEEAKAAALSMEGYKLQLLEINALVKNGGATTAAAAVIPFTTNLGDLEKEQAALATTGAVVTDLEVQEAQAAIAAEEWGASQLGVVDKLKQTTAAYIPASTALEEYTGTLRANIAAQIENEQALLANRAAQKELALSPASSPTAIQVEQLAALREEELLLIESNKALSVTVRNQAKEFIAAGGSIDEMQAQINQLQQSYEQLSEAERASPFGLQLKSEIDTLEPRVKEFEASLGKFGRNVGNYPNGFQSAFAGLNRELTKTQGLLVQGNFSGKELDDLARKQAVLSSVTQTLGKNYSTTAQQTNAFREATVQIGQAFGTNSEVFQNFATNVRSGNKELQATTQAISNANQKGIFNTFYNSLRKIAYVIPGIGIGGLVLLLLDPLTTLGSKLFELSKKSDAASKSADDLRKAYITTGQDVAASSKDFVDAVTTVETLKLNIDLAKQGFLDKNEVLKQYNDTIGKTTGKVTSLDQAEAALTKNGDAYIQMTLLKAAANIALEGAAKKAFDAEVDRRKKESDFANAVVDTKVSAGGAGGFGTGAFDANQFDADSKRISDAQKKRQAEKIKIDKDGEQQQLDIAKKFQDDAAKIAKDNHFDFFGGDETTKAKKSKLSIEEQDALKVIEANRLRLLAIENTSTNEIEAVRKLSFDEEERHLKNVEQINVDAYNAKIALLSKNKNLNAEEKKQLAEFGEQKSQIELETSRKIQAIEKKRFEDQAQELTNQTEQQVRNIKEANQKIQDDPSVSALDKAQAFVDADNKILTVQEGFYNSLSKLNSDFNKEALAKAKANVDNVQKELIKEIKALGPAALKDIQDTAGKAIDSVQTVLAQKTIDLLNAGLSPTETAKRLLALQKEAQVLILANQVAGDKISVDEAKKQLDKKLINEKEYLELVAKWKTAQAALDLLTTNAQLSNIQKLQLAFKEFGATIKENLFGIKQYTNDAAGNSAKIQDVIKETEKTVSTAVTSAYQSYFQNQSAQIDRDNQAQKDFIDRQRQRVLATATSQGEIDTINRQYDAKKVAADKKAGEEKKKLALKEATIDFALAAIKTFATYGWPLGLFAVAGLAIAYGLQRAAINAQQFAKGGQVQPANLGNGRISHGGNIGPLSNGDNVLATVRTGEVILNNRQQAALGGPRTFAAIGVPGFASGGQLGTSLRAPSFSSNYSNPASLAQAIQDMSDLKKMVADVASAVYATDTKEVQLNPNKVTKAQTRKSRDVSIATI